MKYETAKSFILIVLILTSLLLSVAIWTYQPNYDQFQDMSYVHEVDIGGKDLSRNDLIKPAKIIFDNGYTYYGFNDDQKRSELFQDIATWTLYDFQVREIEENNGPNQVVEIVFPTDIPGELLSSLFTFNDDINTPNWSFRRVLITFNDEEQTLNLSFISVDQRMEGIATVERTDNYKSLQNYLLNHDNVIEYVKYESSGEPIYLPKDPVEMTSETLVASMIEPDPFIDVLFSNPALVKSNIGEAYFTDGQRGMKILQDGKQLEFINPTEDLVEQIDVIDLLDRSVENISNHKGWTNDYLLESIDNRLNRVKYRLYYEGYPVFNYQNLATIEQQWRHNELYQYTRPLLYLNNVLDTETVQLSSGEEVIRYIEEHFQDETIIDVSIGYYLSFLDDVDNSFTLHPSWYVRLANNWVKVDVDDEGSE